jgi:hypothetical protein
MIYCVIPQGHERELFDRLADYYADDPNVRVIIERRHAERRSFNGRRAPGDERQVRDRRRPRIPGDLLPTSA